jgi:hypothetical protein
MNEDFFSIVTLDESVSLSCIIPFYISFHVIHIFLRLHLGYYKEQKQKDFEHSDLRNCETLISIPFGSI